MLAEIAICATDLAEVIGTAIGLNLLFGIPLEIGVLITALDVFLILWMQNLGFRWIEAFIVTLLGVIAVCFGDSDRDGRSGLGRGDPGLCADHRDRHAIRRCSISRIGIIGATVMPHNLYLHSGVVQTRRFGDSVEDKREAIKLATIDSTIALMFALLINASILILAAATFNKVGKTDVAELEQAHSFLAPLLGLRHRADAVRHRVAVLRAELDGDGDAVRSDRDGGLPRYPLAGLGAAADHAGDRHRSGCDRDDLVRRGRDGEAPDPQPGGAGPCTCRFPSCRW